MNKKIVYLIHSLPSGGSENVFLRTLPKMKNVDNIVVTLRGKGSLFQKFIEADIPVFEINQKNFFDFKSYAKTLKILNEIRPDAILTNLLHADIYGRFFIQLFTKYNVIPYLQTTYNFKRYWPARLFERTSKHLVKEYLSNSEAVKSFYINNYSINPLKIKVIPNGIDVEFFNNISIDSNYKNSLGIKSDHFIISCVANLHQNKGHIYLIKAFERLYKNNYKIQLLLVGDGPERANLEKMSLKYLNAKDIIFLGKRSDVAQILKCSDLFVLPTFFEGLSNAIMEAMASGLPIITTDISENRELITDNFSGMLCPVKNHLELANIILALKNDSMKRTFLGLNAVKKIKEEYDINFIIEKWENYFKKI